MSQIERRLEKLMDDAGIRIVETGRLSSDLNACYHEPSQTIVIRWGWTQLPVALQSRTS